MNDAIEWIDSGARAPETCPACGQPGPHRLLLRVAQHDTAYQLARCGFCASAFYRHPPVVEYAPQAELPAVHMQSHLEIGAGLVSMMQLLFEVEVRAPSLLDVGCGFGFPVDLASRVLGWRAVGVDPGSLARLGRDLLGADIRLELLTPELDLGGAFGLVVASEVIEHLHDPAAFLTQLRRRLVPGGVLALTTPDAQWIMPSIPPATVEANLSPGLHVLLFSARGLEIVLRRAGFAHTRIQTVGTTLFAYASDEPLRPRPEAMARTHDACAAYYRRLMQAHEPASPLWNGAAARLLDLLSHLAPVAEGFALYETLTELYQERFGIDLHHPTTIPVRYDRSWEGLAAARPLTVPALVWYRARLEKRLASGNTGGLAALYEATIALGCEMRLAMRAQGVDDLAMQDAIWNARVGLACLGAELIPGLAGDVLAALCRASPPAFADILDPPLPLIVTEAAPRFVRLVHAGRYAEALRFLPCLQNLDVTAIVLAADRERQLHTLYCLGVLALNTGTDAPAAFARLAREAAAAAATPATAELGEHFASLVAAHMAA